VPITGNVFVVGTSGSGKSTAAKQIASKLARKHVEIDSLLWLPNWTQRDLSELTSLLLKELANGPVVMDGNFASKGIAASPGDVLIFLDYPRWLVITRLIRRSIARVIWRKELWSGNREQLTFLVSRDPDTNPIVHAFRTHAKRQLAYELLLSNSPDTTNYTIKNPKQLRKLLGEF
jgi:hypothetical protein